MQIKISKKHKYNICFSLDDDYCEQLAVTIASILKNSKENENFKFFVLNEKITINNKLKIEQLKKIKKFTIQFLDIDSNEFKNFPILKEQKTVFQGCKISRAAYFKYKLASIFKDLNKILYLDCDLIISDSLEKLYNIELNDCYAAMAEDVNNSIMAERFKLSNYYNSGVMLVNLKKWRADNIEAKLFECTNNNKNLILWADQDIFNIVFENNIKLLSSFWNCQFFLYSDSLRDELLKNYSSYKVIHFAGKDKPWIQDYNHAIFDEYYKILESTPYKDKNILYKQRKYNHLYKSTYEQMMSIIEKETEHLYKYTYEQIIDKTKKETEHLYKYIYEQIVDKTKKENEDLYKFIYEQIVDKIEKETKHLYKYIYEQIEKQIKDKDKE